MDDTTGNGHLTETERELIRRLFGFGRDKQDHEQILQKKPDMTRQQLEQIESSALRKLRHLDVNELKKMRRAG